MLEECAFRIFNADLFGTLNVSPTSWTVSTKAIWSLWHYLGVARSSLLEAKTVLRMTLGPEPDRLEFLLGEQNATNLSAIAQWDNLLEASNTIKNAIAGRISTKLKMKPLN